MLEFTWPGRAARPHPPASETGGGGHERSWAWTGNGACGLCARTLAGNFFGNSKKRLVAEFLDLPTLQFAFWDRRLQLGLPECREDIPYYRIES
jgi:hypothetical protein